MIVVNLPQFPFRGVEAPYLWVFYKMLSSLRGDTHYFVHQDYLIDPSIWAEQERWELGEETQRNLGYQIPAPASLANASCSLMPDELFEYLLARAHGSPLKAFEQVLSEAVPDLSTYYRAELEALLEDGRVDAILSPINCPSLQDVARLQGIPLIYFELGPLRGPGYIDLAYFDFQGLNEKAEFAERYAGCKQKVGEWNSMGLATVRKQYLRGDYWVSTSARATKYDVGVSMQIEDDTNLIASSNGFSNQGLIAYSKLNFPDKRIAYKVHPGSFFDLKLENGGVSYNSGTDFIFDCDAVLTINSSMGFEALLWGKQAYVLGGAAYAHIATMSDEEKRNKALCFYLRNYLVPFELVFSLEYINFRLTNPSEGEIEKMHITELLRIRTEDMDALRAEGNDQIASLNQAVTERNGEIASLNQAVTERNGEIASLNQTVIERDGQISSLSDETVRLSELVLRHNAELKTERNGEIASLNQTVTERDGQISSLSDETVRLSELVLRHNAELKEERAMLRSLTLSSSWRLTLPLREARRWVSSPTQQVKRYTRGVLHIAKRVYQSLPLDFQTKAKHRRSLAKISPRLLQELSNHPVSFSDESVSENPDLSFLLSTTPIASADLVIPSSDSPLVTIIIPIYGQIDYTLRCLISIMNNLPQSEFELIVVDDCSLDDSFDVLSKVEGIRLLRNEKNQGFISSCNAGATEAKGDYLYFLNNDTQVTSEWLDELLRTFSEFPGTGLAGSKLVYPDGRLQEAGGIIWQDGSAWNFGRCQDPLLPVYNYAREVDYCSGASIMIPKVLFDELGGFDEHYLPAYCEDSDLALKIRDKGYRVIYQPLSTVIHYEGITSGTDTNQGTKAYQIENSKKLFTRWQERLQAHQAPGVDADNAKDRRSTRRVLVIDHCTPTPNQDAGSVTVFNLLLLLREMDFQVTFIPEDNFLQLPEYTSALQRAGIEVLYAPYVTTVEQHLKESENRYDLALLFRPVVVERHLKLIRKHCPKAKVLFHTVDLHFLRMSREAELQSDKTKQKTADEMKQRELAVIRATDACILHSAVELELLQPMLPDAKLHVFPLIMDIKGTSKTFVERRDIVFIGGYQHTPNVDAVLYFVAEVMPLLRKQLSGVHFYVVGSKPPAEIQELVSSDVTITGFVEDLTPLLDKMRVSVAPLRFGAGIKGKIGTAMAVGLPVVATSLAAEGMLLSDGKNICVADGAEDFANTIAKLYQDEITWNKISKNGLIFADNMWGAERSYSILNDILCELNFEITRGDKPLTLYISESTVPTDIEQLATTDVDSAYQKKIQQELAIYEKQVNVHDLPDIYHYWSNKYLVPIFQEAGFGAIAEFFSSNFLVAANRTESTTARFVSVGAGNCDLEVSIAKNLVDSGFSGFIFECLEINPVMLERGKENARENGVLSQMRFVEADFNTWVAGDKYDGVMANQSLHHVSNLEHLYDQVKLGLHAHGSFLISDMIGRNGHQRWPESLEIVNKFWKDLPESYRYNVLLDRLEKEYENWDCSKEGFEGIRAEEVLPLLLERFECEKFVGFGSAIDIFVDRCFGHNFNRESEWDRAFIDQVHAEDEAGLESGQLTSTHMIAVFVKNMNTAPYYSRGIDPVSSIRKL